MSVPVPNNEDARIEALREYRLLDTDPEQAFDDITAIASMICGTPIALVVLVDSHRQWFKSRFGMVASETPREHAFCAHSILEKRTMVVEDAHADERFASNPLVTSDPHIRFYAGAPLINLAGHALGTLCVIDSRPRRLEADHLVALEALARQVVAQMELRRVSEKLAEVLETEKELRELLPMCSWCKGIRNDKGYWERVEDYLSRQSLARLTHGICSTCVAKHFDEA